MSEEVQLKQEEVEIIPKNQYEVYKEPLRKYAITQIIASGCAFFIVLFLLFVPMFQIDLLKLKSSELKYAITLPNFDGENISFSIINELTALFSSLESEEYYYLFSFGIFQLFSIIFFLLAMIFIIISLIKNLLGLRSLNDYILMTYDEIKTGRHSEGGRRRWDYTNPVFYLIEAMIFQVFSLFTSRYTYMGLVNGVNGWITLVIIFGLGAIGAYVYSAFIKKKVKTNILKEDYNIQK